MEVHAEIDSLKSEIAALRADIGLLQSDHDALYRKVASFEASNKHRNLQRLRPPSRHLPPADDPPLILDSYFDDSIKAYFASEATSVGQKPAQNAPSGDSLVAIQERTRQGAYALLESIHRFGGITAFPINDVLYDSSEDALLGLRFDVLSHSSNAFLPSHYVILRRILLKDQRTHWQVFRYTTPAYISLDACKHHLQDPDESRGLRKFCEHIRDALVATQFKHDTIKHICLLSYTDFGLDTSDAIPLALKEIDLQCRRIVLSLAKYSIELHLTSTAIESVSSTLPEAAAFHLTALLTNATIDTLKTAFSSALIYRREENII